MKWNPGCINPYRDNIFHKKHSHRVGCSTFLKPGNMVAALQPLHHRFLHDWLNIRWTEQLAFYRCSLRNPELSISRDIMLPGDLLGLFKQFIKCNRLKWSCLDQNTLCCPQKYIRSAYGFCISIKSNTSVFHLGDFISQIQNFSFEHRFESKMTRCYQFKSFHIFLHMYPNTRIACVKYLYSYYYNSHV